MRPTTAWRSARLGVLPPQSSLTCPSAKSECRVASSRWMALGCTRSRGPSRRSQAGSSQRTSTVTRRRASPSLCTGAPREQRFAMHQVAACCAWKSRSTAARARWMSQGSTSQALSCSRRACGGHQSLGSRSPLRLGATSLVPSRPRMPPTATTARWHGCRCTTTTPPRLQRQKSECTCDRLPHSFRLHFREALIASLHPSLF
mmetsp:Transcript_79462/g.177702  ORF Transcript_79462/g.177702 Transcript_79462/m.177702 type:complete len:203 (+) Transcript_79462:256-864(+)